MLDLVYLALGLAAFALFGGVTARGIYDNMKTAVDAVFAGKARRFNRRFEQMCSHYLIEPVACTPASGWEKGQVENQVGTVRQRFFAPRVRVKSYEELNAWLMDRCIAWAKAQPHPEVRDRTIWEMFEAERPSLVPYAGPFDGFHATPVSPSKTCLVRFDNNKYSVMASAIGRPVEVRAYAERIEIRQDGRIVAEHPRAFSRGQTVFDPWHYVPVLARKPGALRNGAPFKDWVLPAALDRVRHKLAGSADGDRPRQSARSRGSCRPAGPHRGPSRPARPRGAGRTRIPAVRAVGWAVAVPPDQPPLRDYLDRGHHEPRLRGMAERVRRRRQDDHGAARPPHPPLRDRRDRQRELALQEPRLRPARTPRLLDL